MSASSDANDGVDNHAVKIRPARRVDLDAMQSLLRELFSIETEFPCDPAKQRRGLVLLLKARTARAWVATRGRDVVGMVTVQLVVSTAEGGPSGLLEDLVVCEEHRNAGIGTLLLEAAVQWTRAQGATRVQLLADRRNAPAFRFYFRHGWEPTHMVTLRRMVQL
jgi:GNAT superfamily N-acetyltransferase